MFLYIVVVASILWLLLFRRRRGADQAPVSVLEVPVAGVGVLKSLRPSEFDEAAQCMAEAFVDSPWYAFIFQNLSEGGARIGALQFLFSRNLQLMYSKDPHAVLGLRESGGSGSFLCCFILANAKVRNVSRLDMLQAGILELAWRYSFGALRRLVAVADYSHDAEFRAVPGAEKAWQLQVFFFLSLCVSLKASLLFEAHGRGSACTGAWRGQCLLAGGAGRPAAKGRRADAGDKSGAQRDVLRAPGPESGGRRDDRALARQHPQLGDDQKAVKNCVCCIASSLRRECDAAHKQQPHHVFVCSRNHAKHKRHHDPSPHQRSELRDFVLLKRQHNERFELACESMTQNDKPRQVE